MRTASVWQAEEDSFAEVLPAMHAGAVTGVDCAVRRPLAATVGADHAIRLWNHADRCGLNPWLLVNAQASGRRLRRWSCSAA
jgi:hypothetical protein